MRVTEPERRPGERAPERDRVRRVGDLAPERRAPPEATRRGDFEPDRLRLGDRDFEPDRLRLGDLAPDRERERRLVGDFALDVIFFLY